MVHVLGALISRIIAYFINFCAYAFVNMADSTTDQFTNKICDDLLQDIAENNQLLLEIEKLNAKIQHTLRRNCPKNHRDHLLDT